MLWPFVFCLLLFQLSHCIGCNYTAYQSWQLQRYLGILSKDPNFWRYQTQTQFVLTKGLALELVVAKCQNEFTVLQTYKAGRSGPVTVQYAFKAMCSSYCMEADELSNQALDVTGCSCLELSTQKSSPFYQYEGDWCRHNTARLLCDILGYCGVWNCRIDDFMCPRYEWNKKFIPLKTWGSCIRGSASTKYSFNMLMYSALSVTVIGFFFFGVPL